MSTSSSLLHTAPSDGPVNTHSPLGDHSTIFDSSQPTAMTLPSVHVKSWMRILWRSVAIGCSGDNNIAGERLQSATRDSDGRTQRAGWTVAISDRDRDSETVKQWRYKIASRVSGSDHR